MNNRIIKFRAWHKEEKKMFWVDRIDWTRDASNIFYLGVQLPETMREDASKDFELMQFTGLKDKNGTELFEGDIVREYDPRTPDDVTIYKVFWNTARLLFYRSFFDAKEIEVVGKYSTYEIIGNIYENPDLLT